MIPILESLLAGLTQPRPRSSLEDLKPLMANANKRIELDCSQLEYICSLGLRGLLQLKKESVAKGGSMTLTHVEGEVQKILRLTGFNKLLDIR